MPYDNIGDSRPKTGKYIFESPAPLDMSRLKSIVSEVKDHEKRIRENATRIEELDEKTQRTAAQVEEMAKKGLVPSTSFQPSGMFVNPSRIMVAENARREMALLFPEIVEEDEPPAPMPVGPLPPITRHVMVSHVVTVNAPLPQPRSPKLAKRLLSRIFNPRSGLPPSAPGSSKSEPSLSSIPKRVTRSQSRRHRSGS